MSLRRLDTARLRGSSQMMAFSGNLGDSSLSVTLGGELLDDDFGQHIENELGLPGCCTVTLLLKSSNVLAEIVLPGMRRAKCDRWVGSGRVRDRVRIWRYLRWRSSSRFRSPTCISSASRRFQRARARSPARSHRPTT